MNRRLVGGPFSVSASTSRRRSRAPAESLSRVKVEQLNTFRRPHRVLLVAYYDRGEIVCAFR